jgi:hypothetical protein
VKERNAPNLPPIHNLKVSRLTGVPLNNYLREFHLHNSRWISSKFLIAGMYNESTFKVSHNYNKCAYIKWVKGKVVPLHPMKASKGSGGIAPVFLTLALNWSEWLTSHHGRFACCTHSAGDWVGPRPGLEILEKRKISSFRRGSSPVLPVRSLITILNALSTLPVLSRNRVDIEFLKKGSLFKTYEHNSLKHFMYTHLYCWKLVTYFTPSIQKPEHQFRDARERSTPFYN